MHVYMYKSYVSHEALILARVFIRVGTEEDVYDFPHSVGPAHL